jgi:hypothetical protein
MRDKHYPCNVKCKQAHYIRTRIQLTGASLQCESGNRSSHINKVGFSFRGLCFITQQPPPLPGLSTFAHFLSGLHIRFFFGRHLAQIETNRLQKRTEGENVENINFHDIPIFFSCFTNKILAPALKKIYNLAVMYIYLCLVIAIVTVDDTTTEFIVLIRSSIKCRRGP